VFFRGRNIAKRAEEKEKKTARTQKKRKGEREWGKEKGGDNEKER